MNSIDIIKAIYEQSDGNSIPMEVIVNEKAVPTMALRKCLVRLSDKYTNDNGDGEKWEAIVTHNENEYSKIFIVPSGTHFRTVKALVCDHFFIDVNILNSKENSKYFKKYKFNHMDYYLQIKKLNVTNK